MNEEHFGQNPPSISPSDICHILFRHKWKIALVWAVGACAAVVVWLVWPVLYRSEAKLFIRYILENKSVTSTEDANIKTPTAGGDGIINSELEILTSYDLALEVADLVGPEKILGAVDGGKERYAAAGLIREGLKVSSAPGTAIIRLTFEHPDRSVAQPVLTHIVASYLRHHADIHQASGSLNEYLSRQTDQSKALLAETENQLKRLRAQIGVMSLEDTRKAHAERIARIEADLYITQSELAERMALLQQMTNTPAAAVETNVASTAQAPDEAMAEYKRVAGLIESFEKQLVLLESVFTPTNRQIVMVREHLEKNRATKSALEQKYPHLAGLQVTSSGANGIFSPANVVSEAARAAALEAKIAMQQQQLQRVREEAAAVNELEGALLDLQRKRDLHEQNFRYFSARLARAQFDEALGPGRISNIKAIQEPSPPIQDFGKLPKVLLLILGGAGAAGVGLAFLLELYVDRSFKRPTELESKLGVPVFLSIPHVKHNGGHAVGDALRTMRLLPAHAASTDLAADSTSPSRQNEPLTPFYEALRDRLILSFEHRNLVHKPKLVAITSCGEGSGVSTVASGLAASLSETGDGNVLLVDMNNADGVAHYFRKGKLECGLADALRRDRRESAMVQDNLYVVAEKPTDGELPRVIHKRFSSLLPQLRASDYDYIIFDMPPLSQISPTTRIVPFMDMAFLVVESEKTGQETVKRAIALLSQAQAHFGIVLNKTRSYLPRRFQTEL